MVTRGRSVEAGCLGRLESRAGCLDWPGLTDRARLSGDTSWSYLDLFSLQAAELVLVSRDVKTLNTSPQLQVPAQTVPTVGTFWPYIPEESAQDIFHSFREN